MLKGKTIVLGVTGSIAAYKIAKSCKHVGKASCGCTGAYDKECHQFYSPDDI